MKSQAQITIVLLLLLKLTIGAPISLITLANITVPSEDPFYTPKAGYEKLKPGEIIDYRKVNQSIGIIMFEEKIQVAYQFLVRSEDSHGDPNAIVTTVLVPYNADTTKVLSYQAAVDTPDPDCAPSYAMQLGSDPSSWVTTQVEQLLSQAGLFEGWIVVIPDFLGPKGAFGAGYQAAYATLNSLKAAMASGDITGVDPKAKIAMWGYSGGSQPSAWGSALAPTYAPELNLVGTAVGGVLVAPKHIANVTMGGLLSGLIINAITGLANEYPELKTFALDNIYSGVRDNFFAPNHQCLVGSLLRTPFTSWSDVSPLGNSILDAPLVNNITGTNNLLNLNANPKIPLFIYNSKNDEILPAVDTDQLYDKWCKAGTSIEYRQDRWSEHLTQAAFGAGDAFVWLKDRMNGVQQTGCNKIESASNLFNMDTVVGFSSVIADAIEIVNGEKIGPAVASKHPLPANVTVSLNSTVSSSGSSASSTSSSKSSSFLGSIISAIF